MEKLSWVQGSQPCQDSALALDLTQLEIRSIDFVLNFLFHTQCYQSYLGFADMSPVLVVTFCKHKRTRLVEVNWLTQSTVSDMHSWSDHVFFWSIFPWRGGLYNHSVCPARNFGPVGWFQSESEGALNQQRQPSMHRASSPGPESCTVSFA